MGDGRKLAFGTIAALAAVGVVKRARSGARAVTTSGAKRNPRGGGDVLQYAKGNEVNHRAPNFHEIMRGMVRHLQRKPYSLNVGFGNPEALGCGFFGCAYALEDYPGWVVKVTGDPSDAASWQRVLDVVGSGRWPKGLARVLTVFVFSCECLPHWPRSLDPDQWVPKLEEGSHVYGVVMERLEPLDGEERDLLRSDLRSEPVTYRIFFGEPVLRKVDRWLVDHGIEVYDYSADNVMKNAKGELKVTDLGVSVAPRVTIPELHEVDLVELLQRRAR